MTVQNVPGTLGLVAPSITEDGRLESVNLPNRVDIPAHNYWSDYGDDLNSDPVDVGGGQELFIEQTGPGTAEVEWQYSEPVQVRGGLAWLVTDFDRRDHAVVDVYAPASPVSVGGAQNCVLVNLGPSMNLIVPVTPGGGSHEVDLDAKIGYSNVTEVTPVTAVNNDGYFNYDQDTGEVTAAPSGDGGYNLFDFQIDLTRYLNRVRIRTEDWFPADKTRTVLPQWKWKASLTQGGDAGRLVQVCFRMLLFRKYS